MSILCHLQTGMEGPLYQKHFSVLAFDFCEASMLLITPSFLKAFLFLFLISLYFTLFHESLLFLLHLSLKCWQSKLEAKMSFGRILCGDPFLYILLTQQLLSQKSVFWKHSCAPVCELWNRMYWHLIFLVCSPFLPSLTPVSKVWLELERQTRAKPQWLEGLHPSGHCT